MADEEVPTTHATGRTLDEDVVATINRVLEGERGGVLALVQLAAMATDALERHALVVTGGQAAQACTDLHVLLARNNAPVSDRAGDAGTVVQELDRLDDRYLAFGQLQRQLMTQIESIPSVGLDTASAAVLAMTHTVQAAHAAWALQRAHDFAASREQALNNGGEQSVSGDGQQHYHGLPPTTAAQDASTRAAASTEQTASADGLQPAPRGDAEADTDLTLPAATPPESAPEADGAANGSGDAEHHTS